MGKIAVECKRCKNSFVESADLDHEAYDNFVCAQCLKGNYWSHFCFGSGTQIVQFMGDTDLPYYYVHGSDASGHLTNDQQRSVICRELVTFLNRGIRPAWLKVLERHPEYPSRCSGSTPFDVSVDIHATGPIRHHLEQPTEADRAMQEALITKLLEPALWEKLSDG